MLLWVGLNAFFGREEGDDEEDDAEDGEQTHGDLVAARVVAAAEEDDHGDGEALHDEAGGVGEDLPVGGDAGALIGIAGEHAGERRVRDIVDGVDESQEEIRGPRVGELAGDAEAGRGEGEHADDAEGERGPEEPGAKLAPFGVGAVGDHAHDGVEGGGDESDDEKERAGLCGGEAEGVGVVAQLQGEHRLEDEVGSHVAQAVAELLCEGKFLDHSRARLSGVHCCFILMPLLRDLQGEFVEVLVARGGTDHDGEVAGLDDVLHVDVEEGQCTGRDIERDGGGFAWLQMRPS